MPSDLYVYSPNGSESWYVGSSRWIYWRSVSIDTIKIDYSINNGSDWIEITPNTPGPNGKFSWTIPDVSSSQCLIKISDSSNPSNYDTSNAVFTIKTTPTIEVTTPNGSEEWEIDSKENITWNYTNVTNVKIQYSYDNGLNYNTIIDSTAASAGTYEWTIPDHESSQCFVKIICVEDDSILDISNNSFSIIPSSIPGDCVARWIFKTSGYDSDNSRFTDQTGNSHHATNVNGSVSDNYTTMDGSTSKLTIDDFNELSADSKHLSVFIWVDGPLNDGGIFEHWYVSSHQDSWQLCISTSQLFIQVSNNVNNTIRKIYRSDETVLDSTPHSISFTFSDDVLKIYIDGVEDTNINKLVDDSFSTIYNSSNIFDVCYRPETGPAYEYLTTKLYKAYLYNKTLTPSEILVLHNLGT